MTTLKKLTIFSVSLTACFFIGILVDIACGPETDPYDYYVSFFHNNIGQDDAYKSFYFTGAKFLYDDNEQVSEAAINAREWAAYAGSKVKAADVEKVMYHLNGKSDTALYEGYLNNKAALPDSLKNNTFLQALGTNKSACKYYRFAKSVEPITNVAYNNWDPTPMDTVALKDAGLTALANAQTEKDSFIKLRYLYQAQRLLHYGGNHQQAMAVYDKHIAGDKSDSHVIGWALSLKAGEERRLGDSVHSAYLFSKVFAQYPERRVQAYRNYRAIQVTTAQVLTLAKNNNEKAVIHGIEGFGTPGFNINPLNHVYGLEPSSAMVGVLLIREINKLEEQYITETLASNTVLLNSYGGKLADSTKIKAVNNIKQLNAFCEKLYTDKKYPEYPIGKLAQAYLAWMQHDTKRGLDYLAALNNEKLSAKFNDQKQIIALLLTAQNTAAFNEAGETAVLPALKWLDQKIVHETKQLASLQDWGTYGAYPFAATGRNFYQVIMAPAYLKQKDTAKAALVMMLGDITADKKFTASVQTTNFWQNYLHSYTLSQIIAWKKSPPANPYLHFLAQKLSSYSNNELYELLGTAYLREHQYQKAAASFKMITSKKLKRFPSYYNDDTQEADPFIIRMRDYPVMYYTKGNAKGYNKLQFAEAMVAIQKQIAADPKNASAGYFKLATGIYNTSTYGNAWYLIKYDWSAYDYGRNNEYYYDNDYIKTTSAEKYFLIARQLSTNPEFKAKCTFMAAKCRQKQYRVPSYNDYPNYNDNTYKLMNAAEKAYSKKVRQNPYFAELQKNYSATSYYKLAVHDCSYLRDFLRGRK